MKSKIRFLVFKKKIPQRKCTVSILNNEQKWMVIFGGLKIVRHVWMLGVFIMGYPQNEGKPFLTLPSHTFSKFLLLPYHCHGGQMVSVCSNMYFNSSLKAVLFEGYKFESWQSSWNSVCLDWDVLPHLGGSFWWNLLKFISADMLSNFLTPGNNHPFLFIF